ncbi:rhodanese-like domain-containing protein [Sutcliffiella horikoshii]|uniref:rhodanese-like domain-containing protein n=1 Tax=Sutcliffiella horikoshii TaxID=79883 RepID=UPI0007D060B9|nr:rhodanese-like domain-containing protein [Sutcliffiella horikoshii]MCM3619529.1 rhodanese-like domain-containing protein [Sutcliffiella horikoshii]
MSEIQTITTDDLKKKLDAGEELFLVDVREDEEIEMGKIKQAEHIRMGDIPESLDKLDKNNEYIFICRSGRRSENVCHYLQDQGYKVRNLVGGMLEWEGDVE